MEYNSWDFKNPPEHEANLAFTRLKAEELAEDASGWKRIVTLDAAQVFVRHVALQVGIERVRLGLAPIEDRVEVRNGDLLYLHTGWHRFAQFGDSGAFAR